MTSEDQASADPYSFYDADTLRTMMRKADAHIGRMEDRIKAQDCMLHECNGLIRGLLQAHTQKRPDIVEKMLDNLLPDPVTPPKEMMH
jgi:hypothetical protein